MAFFLSLQLGGYSLTETTNCDDYKFGFGLTSFSWLVLGGESKNCIQTRFKMYFLFVLGSFRQQPLKIMSWRVRKFSEGLIFTFTGYYMWKSWANSRAEDLEKWKNCNHLYTWDLGHVRSKNIWSKGPSKTSSVASNCCAQWSPGGLRSSTACQKV